MRLDSVGRLGMSSVLHPWEELISHKIQNKAQMLLSSFMASFSRGPAAWQTGCRALSRRGGRKRGEACFCLLRNGSGGF